MQKCGQHLSTAVSVPTLDPYPAPLISFSLTLITHPSIKVWLILNPCTFQKIIYPRNCGGGGGVFKKKKKKECGYLSK